jgi:hypothetical protein
MGRTEYGGITAGAKTTAAIITGFHRRLTQFTFVAISEMPLRYPSEFFIFPSPV